MAIANSKLHGLQHRDVRYGIKNGLTIAGFCEKYECTEAEFEKKLRALYRRDADDMFDAIRANEKKANRQGSGRQSKQFSTSINPANLPSNLTLNPSAAALFGVSPIKDPPPGTNGNPPAADGLSIITDHEPTAARPAEGSSATISTEGAIPAIPDRDSPEARLAQLRATELVQSDAVMQLESQHKSIARKHRACIADLRQLKTDMESLRDQFNAKAAEYESIVSQNNGFVTQMNQISSERAEKVTLLAATRREIESLSVITLCAYENGTIEPLDQPSTSPSTSLDESGSDQLFTEFRDRADLEELRIKDIRILARMVSIVRNSTHRIEPVFENETLEPYFQALCTA